MTILAATTIGAVTALGLAALTATAIAAASDRQEALQQGAVVMTSEEIEALIVGNTVKARAGDKLFLFHYGDDNLLSGRLIDGKWSGAGYYGITDGDRVCVSMPKDKGRLRCLTLMKQDGAIRKYDAKGDMTFEFIEIQSGNRL